MRSRILHRENLRRRAPTGGACGCAARFMIGPPLSTFLWRLLAVVCVALGVIGMAVPVVPTVPFLIVAAWAGSRGWPRLETWLLEHPRHGPHIRRWRDHGAVPRRAKWFASVMMVFSASALALSPAAVWLKLGAPSVMAIVALWLWRRPET